MAQILNIIAFDEIRDYIMRGKLELLASFYDIFSAKTYYFVADHASILHEFYPIPALKINIVDYFKEI